MIRAQQREREVNDIGKVEERFVIKQERLGFRTQVKELNFDGSRDDSSLEKSVGGAVLGNRW